MPSTYSTEPASDDSNNEDESSGSVDKEDKVLVSPLLSQDSHTDEHSDTDTPSLSRKRFLQEELSVWRAIDEAEGKCETSDYWTYFLCFTVLLTN